MTELDHHSIQRCAEYWPALSGYARRVVAAHQHLGRVATLFSTRKKWLLSQAGLAIYFDSLNRPSVQLSRKTYLALVKKHQLVNRNTAIAFFDYTMNYEFVRFVSPDRTGTDAPIEPSEHVIKALEHWLVINLQTLDEIYGGSRIARIANASPSVMAELFALIAHYLLASPAIRDSGTFYAIFSSGTEGDVIMDRLIADAEYKGDEKTMTGVSSISALATGLSLSRNHTGRKFKRVEKMGGVGWSGRKGASPMWVSAALCQEYGDAQAAKLVIIEQALRRLSLL